MLPYYSIRVLPYFTKIGGDVGSGVGVEIGAGCGVGVGVGVVVHVGSGMGRRVRVGPMGCLHG